MKRIGIFGGTFDPPHQGHLIIAEQVCEAMKLDEIWFIPSYLPPHKQKAAVSSDERLEMVTKAIQENKRFHSLDLELIRQGKSYTFDTMEQLTEDYPDDKFYFIIGGDMVDSLQDWYRIEELKNLITFVGVRREGSKRDTTKDVVMIDVPRIDISSTLIRERLKKGFTVRYLIPEAVHHFIKENSLYALKS
ncbi:nicotinate-nucleotide adenylyltransferase [Halobacillus naozhouensis]|uniref:Probable nicotinate-nucleotide adenylyltransferase n=1 Tax=Halobacillus naozhouensis TaxID=554880 RepID=A0ABY8ITG2_9BACI|nr:nicotinate-nucleotide adenylyltransferase [Halobacillus naozhouensis]WFT73318.1 nicotinate-nucleotide adenylyltransferase [Halobacillus naozhouensis]